MLLGKWWQRIPQGAAKPAGQQGKKRFCITQIGCTLLLRAVCLESSQLHRHHEPGVSLAKPILPTWREDWQVNSRGNAELQPCLRNINRFVSLCIPNVSPSTKPLFCCALGHRQSTKVTVKRKQNFLFLPAWSLPQGRTVLPLSQCQLSSLRVLSDHSSFDNKPAEQFVSLFVHLMLLFKHRARTSGWRDFSSAGNNRLYSREHWQPQLMSLPALALCRPGCALLRWQTPWES